MPTLDTLEKLKAWASIFSSIALPVVLAVVGFFVQKSLASEGLKKDYVQIAVGVLSQDPSKQDKEIRAWAIALINETAPVKFTPAAQASLQKAPLKYDNNPSGPYMCNALRQMKIVGGKFSEEESRALALCERGNFEAVHVPPTRDLPPAK